MKRIALISLAIVFLFAGSAIAACPGANQCLLGCGIVKGTVKLCSSTVGQEGAQVTLTGRSADCFNPLTMTTDADGKYKFRAMLPVCVLHKGVVNGYFLWKKCCGSPDEEWEASKGFRFRMFNQGEQQIVRVNLKLRYARQIP